ncbi:hypothetical protein Acr_13g0003560 [Actinidia rufa]|uniref:Uncharacterized protein n=1 Tax=Actinidia rufa TaxID=165716 RepID=A0A7J0FJT2_9ERIC|nr:hypothetical protein Acr_13g0003560 [Actinidia rufa]
MVGTLPTLVASLGISSHWLSLFEIQFILNPGKELVVVPIAFSAWLTSSFNRANIYTRDIKSRISIEGLRIKFFQKSFLRSQPKLLARHCQLLEALFYLVVCLTIALAIAPNRLVLTLPASSLSNHFSPRFPKLDGNTQHIKATMWFQRAIICLNMANVGPQVGFPIVQCESSMAQTFLVGPFPRFLGRMEFAYHEGPSMTRLSTATPFAYSITQICCHPGFLALNTTRVASLYKFQRDGSLAPPDFPRKGSLASIHGGSMSLLSTRMCDISTSCTCRCLTVISRLSSPSGSNRHGLCFEVTLAVLCASASSLVPLRPGVLGNVRGLPSGLTVAGTIIAL